MALERAEIPVEEYAAFEIDRYATAISRFNFPDIQRFGDVLTADFSMFKGFDMVIGGSPCTFWSIAKSNRRELDRSGVGWLLFSRFADAVRTVRPKYFLYENVASMPANIKAYISEELGAEPILINSALVSAQQRKRLYWTNIPNVQQPADKGILLKDILEDGAALGAALRTRGGGERLEVRADGKSNALTTVRTDAMVCAPVRLGEVGRGGQGARVYSVRGKSVCLSANGGGGGAKTGLYRVNLPDGDYGVRKLSPAEAERCQTLPDGYTAFGTDEAGNAVKISDTQRYKCIGNGWTVEGIAHIFSFIR